MPEKMEPLLGHKNCSSEWTQPRSHDISNKVLPL